MAGLERGWPFHFLGYNESMTNEEILEKQVEALEKLLQLKQAIIDEQDSKINKLEMEKIHSQPPYPINLPYIGNPAPMPFIGGGGINFDPCPIGPIHTHDYPTMWHGTTPPPCSKCGKQSQASTVTWTVTNASNKVVIDPNAVSNTKTTLTTIAKR